MRVASWVVREAGRPMGWEERDERPADGEVLVEVSGCGICHTDLGFFYEGVPTRTPFPLTLGHEVSGRVVEAGPGAERWLSRAVVVPAVIPCGGCEACRAGRGRVCRHQVFPGSDVHGGFGTHLRVPARGLCEVPDLGDSRRNPGGLDLPTLAVVADAVSTPYQAIVRSGLAAGDLAVFVGAGGIGGFGAQIAAALGAHAVALDVDPGRLLALAGRGVDLTLDPAALPAKDLRRELRRFADERGIPSFRTRIFETSGTPAGQATAFGLLGPGGYLGIVGYTPRAVELRLSNLMAFDATAEGTWGCLPELYPKVVDLCLSGAIALTPFVERRPMAAIQDVFEDLHARGSHRRVVLLPEA
jgi:6-hydroxycyclohex-1-ene-1-carbonyl-CoA dehydrogenase